MTDPRESKGPSQFTKRVNSQAGSILMLDDPGDWERATRGKIAEHPTGAIAGPLGGIAWNTADLISCASRNSHQILFIQVCGDTVA